MKKIPVDCCGKCKCVNTCFNAFCTHPEGPRSLLDNLEVVHPDCPLPDDNEEKWKLLAETTFRNAMQVMCDLKAYAEKRSLPESEILTSD